MHLKGEKEVDNKPAYIRKERMARKMSKANKRDTLSKIEDNERKMEGNPKSKLSEYMKKGREGRNLK